MRSRPFRTGWLAVLLAAAAPPCAASAATTATITDLAIDLTLDVEHGILEQDTTVTVSGAGSGPLEFGLGPNLLVERMHARGSVVEFDQVGSRVRVTFDPPLRGERRFRFRITGRPRRGAIDLVTPAGVALGAQDRWYPTIPGSAATVTLRVRAPDGWTVLGPGQAAESADGPVEYRSEVPLRGVAVAAAPGLRITEAAVVRNTLRLAAPVDAPAADAMATVLADPFAWMSGALAPYPYDGFNLARVPGLPARAQGSGFLATPLDTPIDGRSDGAALLAGQWWGEILGGDGPWIDAFAAWQAVTYARDRTEPMPREIEALRDEYLLSGQTGDVALARVIADSPPRVVRGKGSAAPDMIRLGIGDRPFFRAIQAIFERAGPEPVSLASIEAAFRETGGDTVPERFRQWFGRTGVPALSANFRSMPAAGGGWRVDLRIEQAGEPYMLPVEVVFRSAGSEHRERIDIREPTESVYYLLPIEAVRAEIDPLGRIFMQPVRWPRP